MKKLMKIFGAFLIASVVLSSCGSDDPKENGIAAGEIECECKEIEKEIKEIQKKIGRLEWRGDKASEESREEIAELEMDKYELRIDLFELFKDEGALEQKRWTATKGEDDQKYWDEDFADAKNDYIKENCKDD
jgi:hypothetical protein